MTETDKRFDIVDEKPPLNTKLSAHYKQCFAYFTIRDRLPVILTQIIDQLARDKEEILLEYDEEAKEDLKNILASLSKLKYELQTDKEFVLLDKSCPDHEMWNQHILSLAEKKSYYSTAWLYAECYLYRRIKAIFEESLFHKDFDYFQKLKENALTCCYSAQILVAEQIDKFNASESTTDRIKIESFFKKLLKLNLWGNRCDLSITAGIECKQGGDPFSAIEILDPCILIDHTTEVWNCISEIKEKDVIVDIVNDNSGYEFFTDLCLADFMIMHKIASRVRFYVKPIPWFISDVTPRDFYWTLETLRSHENHNLVGLGQRCSNYLKSGQFELMTPSYFWTSGYEFNRMNEIESELYETLQRSDLILFKGDLNYRKIVGDIYWEPTTTFEDALQGFRPNNLCSLRTVKADTICGLKEGIYEKLNIKDSHWMESGEYGIIQFLSKV